MEQQQADPKNANYTHKIDVEAQKELIDYMYKSARKNMLSIFMYVFPVTIIAMLAMVVLIRFLVG